MNVRRTAILALSMSFGIWSAWAVSPCNAQYSGRVQRTEAIRNNSYRAGGAQFAPVPASDSYQGYAAGNGASGAAANGAGTVIINNNNYYASSAAFNGGGSPLNMNNPNAWPWNVKEPYVPVADGDPTFHAPPPTGGDRTAENALIAGDIHDSSTSLQSTLNMQTAAALQSFAAGQGQMSQSSAWNATGAMFGGSAGGYGNYASGSYYSGATGAPYAAGVVVMPYGGRMSSCHGSFGGRGGGHCR